MNCTARRPSGDCGARTDTYLCRDCLDELAEVLRQIPGLMHDVSDAITRQTRVYRASGKTRTPDPDWRGTTLALTATPLPVDLDASAVLTEAWTELVTTALDMAERRGAEPPLEDPAGWLLANLDAIALDEFAAEITTRLHGLRATLRRTVDRSPSRVYAGPCHAKDVPEVVSELRDGTVYVQRRQLERCDQQLYAQARVFDPDWLADQAARGQDVAITCDGCGTRHTVADRRYWLQQAVSESLVALDEVRDALPTLFPTYEVPPRTVMLSWARRGRLIAVGTNSHGQDLFLGADVLDLVADYRPREQRTTRRKRRHAA